MSIDISAYLGYRLDITLCLLPSLLHGRRWDRSRKLIRDRSPNAAICKASVSQSLDGPKLEEAAAAVGSGLPLQTLPTIFKGASRFLWPPLDA